MWEADDQETRSSDRLMLVMCSIVIAVAVIGTLIKEYLR